MSIERGVIVKPFWQRPPKKKRKHRTAPQKQASWIPPFHTTTKPPVTKEKLLVESPVTYQIQSPAVEDTAEPSIPLSPPKEKVVRPKIQQARKEFLQTFRSLTGRWRSWDIWTDFITMAACAISNAVDGLNYEEREKTYLKIINKYSKEEQQLFPKLLAHLVLALEENPEQDFLGEIYTELGLNSKEHEQIFTPYNVAYMMAEIVLGDIEKCVEEFGYVEIHDCCCGGGVTLIAAVNVAKRKLGKVDRNFQNHVLVSGQDIDYVVAMMCYIQLSLLGIAGYFKVGNALTEPMTSSDSLENYWFTPMYFFPVWHYRRIWHRVEKLIGGNENGKV